MLNPYLKVMSGEIRRDKEEWRLETAIAVTGAKQIQNGLVKMHNGTTSICHSSASWNLHASVEEAPDEIGTII